MKLDLLGERQRTHYCGDVRKSDAGKTVFLAGWVARRRDLGNLIFLDLRDHTGITQVVCTPELSAEAHDKAEEVRAEYVVGVEGEVVPRDAATVNPQLATGEVEVKAKTLLLLNEAKTPPFPIEDEIKTIEETRLRYRYLDLRRGKMQQNIRLRHHAGLTVREYMSENRFIEVETPFMTRSTPEGARDYLVPSRVHHGRFYALPQSPQLFKQLLMIAGYDRYFQIVRCFRDEDLRADRQPEFTQIDIEMAFPTREALFNIIEGLIEKMFALVDVKVTRPFPRLSYDTAMERYGSDKPDLRCPLEWKRLNLSAEVASKSGVHPSVKAMRIPEGGSLSGTQFKKLLETLNTSESDWHSVMRVDDSRMRSALAENDDWGALQPAVDAAGAGMGDRVVMVGKRARWTKVDQSLPSDLQHRLDVASGDIRLEVARRLNLLSPGVWKFLWVVDFPMFEYDEKEKGYGAMHHPFTSPREDDLDKLESDPSAVKALAYDLVLNGAEIGGGSIRIHRQDIQKRIFTVLGLSHEKARERFGFFLDALESGTPPHGGIALGYDRIIALMAGESNIREVIAFPKTASAVDMMCDAPATVDPEQLDELGLKITGN